MHKADCTIPVIHISVLSQTITSKCISRLSVEHLQTGLHLTMHRTIEPSNHYWAIGFLVD